MRILGVDQSFTAFGWAVLDTEAQGRARCRARGHKGTRPRYPFYRVRELRSYFSSVIEEQAPDYVCIEEPLYGKEESEGLFALFLFCLDALYDANQDVLKINSSQRQAFVRRSLGRPSGWRVDKGDVAEAAQRDADGGGWTSDEADAYMIALMGSVFWRYRAGELTDTDLTEYERGWLLGTKRKKGILHRKNERFFLWSKSRG